MVDGEQKPEYFAFAARVLGESFEYPACKCVASLTSTGEIMGVVIYSQTTATNAMMSVASDLTGRFLTRQFLHDVFWVPFVQWGKPRVTILIRASNAHSQKFCRKLGFVQEGLVRRAYGNEDGLLFGMLREECRYLKEEKNG
jgi:hypothetical protein